MRLAEVRLRRRRAVDQGARRGRPEEPPEFVRTRQVSGQAGDAWQVGGVPVNDPERAPPLPGHDTHTPPQDTARPRDQ